jgi:stage II sporulation protein D
MLRILLLALCSISASAQTVRIGVFTLFHPTQLEIQPVAPNALLITGGHTALILNGEPGHARAVVRLANGSLHLGPDAALTITISARDNGPADFILSIPGKITRRYYGVLAISADTKQLTPVVSMDIETATASIVAAESPPGATIEALKAQAVVARSFLSAGSRHHDYDFCDTTHCQFLRQPPPLESRASEAVRATRGLILTWHGAPLAAMYSSRCGGRTASLRDIGISFSGYPYFAVSCAYCRRHPVKWSRSLSAADAKKLAQSGESERLALGREYGWSAIPSNRYAARQSSSGVILTGEGAGHGVGLCQYGAAGMAAEGANFGEILRHYYPETEIASIPSLPTTQP